MTDQPTAVQHAPLTAAAWADLVALLDHVGREFIVPERRSLDPTSTADAFRFVAHVLQSALFAHAELDPDRPSFKRIVSPTRKFTGDNADAIYFETEISPDREYVVRGELAGAVYTSFTVEANASGGAFPDRTCGVLNDRDIDVAADGSYEIVLGGQARERNWLDLPDDAGRITTRHYFEHPIPAAANQGLLVPLSIAAVHPPAHPPPTWSDARVADSLQRVITHVRGKTVDAPPPGAIAPTWVSRTPNDFPIPERPGDLALSAFDAAYSMAPYALGPEEALVMTSRWPECAFANVCLWNLHGQTYDYVNRPVARNRSNTVLGEDGSFRMVIAHQDPDKPNWLDTEGRPMGMVFWRYFLPEGELHPIEAEVVPFADL